MEALVPRHIHYTLYLPERTAIHGAILLLHGMQEHSGRYARFANYLKDNGYVVLTYDHVGHGRTAKAADELGFFHLKHPDDLLVTEAGQMAGFLSQRYPDIPLILVGHSMGSFIARLLLQRTNKLFSGSILIGTGGPNPMAALARPILAVANRIAPTKRSKWLNNLFTSINNQKFKKEKPNDGTNWLSVSLTNREAFIHDELCGVDFSNNGFYGLITLNVKATASDWATAIPPRFPFLFVSGANDPIGDFGKGVGKTVKGLRDQGFEQVDFKLYPGMRHEILNEDNRQSVFEDIAKWLAKTVT